MSIELRLLLALRLRGRASTADLESSLGPIAATVEAVGRTVREQLAVEAELRSASAQVRASAAVILAAPVGFTVVLGAADPGVVAFLTGTPVGLGCLAGGVVCDLVGGLWMARILRRVR